MRSAGQGGRHPHQLIVGPFAARSILSRRAASNREKVIVGPSVAKMHNPVSVGGKSMQIKDNHDAVR